jgi:serine phosphatase RsbU (regulator of sigma subunit)/HAMP domain-containing protein
MAVILFLTLAVTGMMSFMLLNIQKKSLTNEMELRGVSITRNIANNIADFILIKYDLEAAKILKEAMQNNGVRYAMVTDPKGIILAHNDMTRVKTVYTPPGRRLYSTPEENTVYETASGEKVIEFTAAVVAKRKVRIGVAYVGISYDLIGKALKQTYIDITLVTFIAVLLSVAGAFLLSTAITKPIHALAEGARIAGRGELEHKIHIKSSNELGLLADAFNTMTDGLKKAQQAEIARLALEKELEIAWKIQDSLLPKSFPDMKKYEVAAFYRPAKEIGGDYYDVISLSGGRFGMVMADVSGKGIPAALIMTMLSGILNMEARANPDPVTVLTKLNDGLLAKVGGGMFATIFYAVLDTNRGFVEMASAGHHEILVYNAAAARVESYCPKGAAIGILNGGQFGVRLEKITLKVETGDKLLLFTDGISEARSAGGGRFGMDRTARSLEKNGGKTCRAVLDNLLGDVEEFTGGQEQSDDIAVLSIGRNA